MRKQLFQSCCFVGLNSGHSCFSNFLYFRYCLKESSDPNQPRYGIEYKTVALPFGIGANQDLVRLAVYTNDDVLHLNTKYVCLW